jgi:hypothetical protein
LRRIGRYSNSLEFERISLATHPGLTKANSATKLDAFFGVTIYMQRRIGTFIVVWGMFEVSCEPLIWALQNEEPTGKHPSTDRKPIIDLLLMMAAWSEKNEIHEFSRHVAILSSAAQDLVAYRNAIIHGRVFIGPSFIANAPVWGELRKRQKATAHTSDHLLDMAADAADILFKCAGLIAASIRQDLSNTDNFFATMTAQLKNAQSFANELRHLEEIVHSEKY